MRVTLEQLEVWEALAAKATPEPWVHDDRTYKLGDTDKSARSIVGAGGYGVISCAPVDFPDAENAEFIAASRTAIPELCAALREAIGVIKFGLTGPWAHTNRMGIKKTELGQLSEHYDKLARAFLVKHGLEEEK